MPHEMHPEEVVPADRPVSLASESPSQSFGRCGIYLGILHAGRRRLLRAPALPHAAQGGFKVDGKARRIE